MDGGDDHCSVGVLMAEKASPSDAPSLPSDSVQTQAGHQQCPKEEDRKHRREIGRALVQNEGALELQYDGDCDNEE